MRKHVICFLLQQLLLLLVVLVDKTRQGFSDEPFSKFDIPDLSTRYLPCCTKTRNLWPNISFPLCSFLTHNKQTVLQYM